jgi:PAS domain S-box-containing protein
MPEKNLPSTRFLIAGVLLGAAAVLVAAVSVWAMHRLHLQEQAQIRSGRMTALANRSLLEIELQSTSLRGFLLLADRRYLEEGLSAGARLRSTLDSIAAAMEHPEGKRLVRAVREREARYLEAFLRARAFATAEPGSETRREFFYGTVAPLKAGLDSAAAGLYRHQLAMHGIAAGAAASSFGRAVMLVASTCGVSLLLAGLLAANLQRRLEAVQAQKERLRRESERMLRENEERFRMVTRATNDAVYDWDMATGRVWWNDGIRTLFGYDMREAGWDVDWWTAQVHPDDREAMLRGLREAVARNGEHGWKAEYRYRTADGGYKDVLDRGYFLRDAEGRCIRMIGAMMDVSALKAAEEELRKFRLLVEESYDFIVIAGFRGECLYLNAGARRMVGSEDADCEDVMLQDYLFPEDCHPAERAIAEARGMGLWQGELRIRNRRTRQPVPVWWTLFALRQPGVEEPFALAGIGRDLTVIREQEELIRQGLKLEAIGKLAGGIAHDFNNILTVINGYGELLLQRLPGSDPNRQLLEVMMDSGRRAATLTAQLLAYSRRQVLQPRRVDLNQSLAEAASILRRLIGEDIELRLSPDPALDPVKADPGQIGHILLNLCLNAREAMDHGGIIVLETAQVVLESGLHGRYGDLAPGRYSTFAVIDTGKGMTPEVRDRLFEPYFTTKEMGRGTGLGLSSVYGIVRQSGGGIEVSSEPGKGSTFRIYLPSIPAGEQREEGPVPAAPAEYEPGSGRILLVEDEDPVRRITRSLLENGGYSVQEARDGFEALALYHRTEPPPDLILTDVVMPRMGGRKLAEEVRRIRPEQAVLFMSGYSEEGLAGGTGAAAEADYLQKPFTSQSLLEAVESALHAQALPRA